MTYLVRAITPDEAPLVIKSWLKSSRADEKARKTPRGRLPDADYYQLARPEVERTFEAHGAWAAVFPQVPDEVVSWACVDDDGVLQFAYTKSAYRGRGAFLAIARHLGLVPGVLKAAVGAAPVVGWAAKGLARVVLR